MFPKVFVSNLAYEVGWQDLKDHMRQAGNVLHVDVFIGNDGRSKGLGTVEFSRPFEVRIVDCTGTRFSVCYHCVCDAYCGTRCCWSSVL